MSALDDGGQACLVGLGLIGLACGVTFLVYLLVRRSLERGPLPRKLLAAASLATCLLAGNAAALAVTCHLAAGDPPCWDLNCSTSNRRLFRGAAAGGGSLWAVLMVAGAAARRRGRDEARVRTTAAAGGRRHDA